MVGRLRGKMVRDTSGEDTDIIEEITDMPEICIPIDNVDHLENSEDTEIVGEVMIHSEENENIENVNSYKE